MIAPFLPLAELPVTEWRICGRVQFCIEEFSQLLQPSFQHYVMVKSFKECFHALLSREKSFSSFCLSIKYGFLIISGGYW